MLTPNLQRYRHGFALLLPSVKPSPKSFHQTTPPNLPPISMPSCKISTTNHQQGSKQICVISNRKQTPKAFQQYSSHSLQGTFPPTTTIHNPNSRTYPNHPSGLTWKFTKKKTPPLTIATYTCHHQDQEHRPIHNNKNTASKKKS